LPPRGREEEPDIEIAAEASDGRMAVELSRRLKPDVVLMDINMPAMNGIEATRGRAFFFHPDALFK